MADRVAGEGWGVGDRADPVGVAERLVSEGLLGLAAAAPLAGTFRAGRRCHPSTLARWCLDGVRTADGRTVWLEHVRLGTRLMTSRAAVVRFLAAQAVAPAPAGRPVSRSAGARRAASERAADALERAGA